MNIIPEATIKPTQSQQEGIDKIKKFLDSDESFFVLQGPAGSGKSTMIKLALEKLLNEKQTESSPSVYGITVAHQAKNVLKKSIKYVGTFAKAYGYREKIDELTGERTFVPMDKKYLKEPPYGCLPIPVFVHDEVSMYSYKMLDIVKKNRSPFSKIIFMGDSAQLPPIDPSMQVDEDSPVFNLPVPDWCKHTLTERVRQKEGNPILDLSDIIREEIFGSQNIIKVITKIIDSKINNGCGYQTLDEKRLYDHYIKNSKGNYFDNKIIAFRNSAVNKFNTDIRNIIFNNPVENILEKDIICLTNNYMVDSGVIGFKLENSMNFSVREVKKRKLYTDFVDFPIEVYYAYVDDIEKHKNQYIITPTENGIHDYELAKNELLINAKSNPKEWKSFYEFQNCFAQFTMGYSVNAYRSQGSTYKNVYVDLIDILSVKPLTVKRKLQTIYTAITRPTDKVYFIKK